MRRARADAVVTNQNCTSLVFPLSMASCGSLTLVHETLNQSLQTGPYARLSDPHDSTNSSEAGRLLNGPVVYQAPHGGSISFQSNAYTYRYGPKGITGITRNRYTLLCAVFASIGGLSFGYDQGVVSSRLLYTELV
jgi:hypothetical protein